MINESGLIIRKLDPRIKIFIGFLLGILVWRASWPGLTIYFGLLVYLLVVLSRACPEGKRVFKSYAFFVVFWTLMKFGTDLLSNISWQDAVVDAALIGTRLSVLLLLGLVLALSASSRQMGLALSSILRPVLGHKRAWLAALSVSLMVHFLPQAWATLDRIRETVSLRCSNIGRVRRFLLIVQAVIRNLGQKTWDQTLALASRGLDTPESWSQPIPTSAAQWLVTFVLSLILIGLSFF